MENKKYELTNETIEIDEDNFGNWSYEGTILHRIKALRDFGDVKAGDLGGFIEKEENLSHDGDCWVADNASVSGYAQVSGNTWVHDNAQVFGKAKVSDNAMVYGDAVVSAYASIEDNANVYGNAMVSGNVIIRGNIRVNGNTRVIDENTIL